MPVEVGHITRVVTPVEVVHNICEVILVEVSPCTQVFTPVNVGYNTRIVMPVEAGHTTCAVAPVDVRLNTCVAH